MDAMTDPAGNGRSSREATTGTVLLKGGTLDLALQRLLPVLRAGDLIFIERGGWPYRHMARGGDGWSTDVGLCLQDEAGDWVVYEAAIPLVRRVPLERYLRHTHGARLAVRRLKAQPRGDGLQRLTAAAERCVGRFNAGHFDMDTRQLFAAKLVHQVFRAALDVCVGQPVTLGDLQPQLPASTLRFWRFWYLGAVPWQRHTLMPHSQYTDPGLETVFESC